MAKRRCTEADWSALQVELLHLILKKLALMDIARFNSVCCSWHMAVESYISSPIYTTPQIPCLMLASNHHHQQQRDDANADADADTCRGFFSVSENKFYKVKNMFGGFHDAWCVGSFKGWLLILDELRNPHLVHPFSRTKIQLPLTIDLITTQVLEEREYQYSEFIEKFGKCLFAKFILLSDPSRTHTNSYTVVVLFRSFSTSKLALCKNGDKTWTHFATKTKGNHFWHITCKSSSQLYAFTGRGIIEVWDIQEGNFPRKITNFQSTPNPTALTLTSTTNQNDIVQDSKRFCQFYVVELLGELLLVTRLIVEHQYTGPNPTHSTVHFLVLKLDYRGKKWSPVKTLSGGALFVGGNESIFVSTRDFPGCEEDSIYYVDDHWPRRNNGSDIGVYNLKEERFNRGQFFNLNIDIQPPNTWLFWFVPST